MTVRIYRYVVRHDGGSAPHPYGDVCTLAICKPKIRKSAKVDDWIIGFRSKSPDKVVYVMQVSQWMPFANYWRDPRFLDRQPGASPVPDNIYQPHDSGDLIQVDNPIHDESNRATDLDGKNVMIGRRFWYFGSDSPMIPTELIHLVPYPRGHTVNKNRKQNDVQNLEAWLSAWPCGIHGEPINASPELKYWLESNTEKRTTFLVKGKDSEKAGFSSCRGNLRNWKK